MLGASQGEETFLLVEKQGSVGAAPGAGCCLVLPPFLWMYGCCYTEAHCPL